LELRTAASISQAAGGSCIISHLPQSAPTAHYVSRSVLLVFGVSQNSISAFLKKKKETTRTAQQSNPPLSSILATAAD
jgi:hypothetical protein